MQDSFSVLPCRSIHPVMLLLLTVTLRLCPSVSPSPTVHPSPSLFGSLLSPLTLRLCSPNLLFPLLVFVFASQSRFSRRLHYVFALLSRYFSCQSSSQLASLAPPALTVRRAFSVLSKSLFNRPLALFRHRYSFSSSFSLHTCTRAG